VSSINWPRSIAHLDLDAFYAAVEEILNPDLKGLPIIVGMGESIDARAVVATASYAARAFGVHSAMPVSQARRLCPEAVYLPVRHHLYREYSGKVMKILREEAPRLEQVSIDEAYLDLADYPDPVELAKKLKMRISAEIGLTASIGLATNKLIAKMASGNNKPNGLTIVWPGEEVAFLEPKPVGKLHGVGPKTVQKLEHLNIFTIGELASADLALLQETFGQRGGRELQEHARGIDIRPVETESEVKSISLERTFSKDTATARDLWHYIQEMALSLDDKLKKQELLARTIGIKLRLSNFKTITRAETLPAPTDDAGVIAASAARLMRRSWQRGTPLRLLGVRVSNFIEANAPRQLELLPLKDW
jgi:DNA polymerase-4